MEWIVALIFAATFLIGYLIGSNRPRHDAVGTLRIDHSDPDDGPYVFLEVDAGIGDISRKPYVVLRVSNERL